METFSISPDTPGTKNIKVENPEDYAKSRILKAIFLLIVLFYTVFTCGCTGAFTDGACEPSDRYALVEGHCHHVYIKEYEDELNPMAALFKCHEINEVVDPGYCESPPRIPVPSEVVPKKSVVITDQIIP